MNLIRGFFLGLCAIFNFSWLPFDRYKSGIPFNGDLNHYRFWTAVGFWSSVAFAFGYEAFLFILAFMGATERSIIYAIFPLYGIGIVGIIRALRAKR